MGRVRRWQSTGRSPETCGNAACFTRFHLQCQRLDIFLSALIFLYQFLSSAVCVVSSIFFSIRESNRGNLSRAPARRDFDPHSLSRSMHSYSQTSCITALPCTHTRIHCDESKTNVQYNRTDRSGFLIATLIDSRRSWLIRLRLGRRRCGR